MRVALHLFLIYLFNQPRHVGYRLKIKEKLKMKILAVFSSNLQKQITFV